MTHMSCLRRSNQYNCNWAIAGNNLLPNPFLLRLLRGRHARVRLLSPAVQQKETSMTNLDQVKPTPRDRPPVERGRPCAGAEHLPFGRFPLSAPAKLASGSRWNSPPVSRGPAEDLCGSGGGQGVALLGEARLPAPALCYTGGGGRADAGQVRNCAHEFGV